MSSSEIEGSSRLTVVPGSDEPGHYAERRPLPEFFQHDGVVFDAGVFLDYDNLDYRPNSLSLAKYARRWVGKVGLVVTPETAHLEHLFLDREGGRGIFAAGAIKIAHQEPSRDGLGNLYAAAIKDLGTERSRTAIVADLSHMAALEGLSEYRIALVKRTRKLGEAASLGLFGYTLLSDSKQNIMTGLARFTERNAPSNQPEPPPHLRVVE